MKHNFALSCFLLGLFGGAFSIQAAEVWTGPKITFSKPAFANPTLAENQDRITSNVWLTRGEEAGIYNAATEAAYLSNVSPADTEWSLGTTAEIGSLIFQDWRTAIGLDPPNSVGQDLVLHLITDDIYLDIKFMSWGMQPDAGGFFSYERSTPIPEPATWGLVVAAASCWAALARRR